MDKEIKYAGYGFIAMGLFFFGLVPVAIPICFIGTGALAIFFSNQYKF